MKIVAISDTHGMLDKVRVPEGDVLIHCGDLLNHGTAKEFFAEIHKLAELGRGYEHVLYCPGNHDFFVQENQYLAKETCLNMNITLLLDKEEVIDGVKFYGTPWTPIFYDWAFNAPPEKLTTLFSFIPEDTDILVTHGPAYGILDRTVFGENIGSQELLDRIKSLRKLNTHLFGHCHFSYGASHIKNDSQEYTAVNCASCGEDYKLTNFPFEFHMKEYSDR